MTKKNKVLLVIICMGFILLPIVLPSRPTEFSENGNTREMFYSMLGNALILIFFYINYSLLIPKLLFQKKHVLYGCTIGLGLVLILFLPAILLGPNISKAPLFPAKPPIHTETVFRKFQHFFF